MRRSGSRVRGGAALSPAATARRRQPAGPRPARSAGALVCLLAAAVATATAQQPTPRPAFAGYRLGTPRADLPAGLTCSGLVCQASDSVTLHLRGGVVTMIAMSTTIDDGQARTAAELWRSFYRAWSESRFGPADSVWTSPNRTQVRARWRSAPGWEAGLSLAAHLGGRPYVYVDVRLACLTPDCRRPPDGPAP